MQTRSSAAANAEKPYGDVSFTLESGLSTDEILRKSDSSSAIVWDEFESEKINSTSDLSKQRRRRREDGEGNHDDDDDDEKVNKAPGAVLNVKSSKNLDVLSTSENIGVMIAVASQTTTAQDVLDFYSPLAKSHVDVGNGTGAPAADAAGGETQKNRRWSIGNNTEMTNKERTDLLRKFLCECAKKGSFSLIIYDAHSGRVCAARTAASPKLFFGFDTIKNKNPSNANDECKRGLCVSTDEKSLMNVDFSILPSGRFIYGRQYVKPMEFTEFWSTARANRPAVPAKQNSPEPRLSGDSMNSALSKEEKIMSTSNSVQTTPRSKGGARSDNPYTPDSGMKDDYMKAMRYAPTGSRGDLRDVWNAGRGSSADINPEEAKKIQKQVEEISKMSSAMKRELINNKNKEDENTTPKTRMAENDTDNTHGPPLKKISIDRAYRPPSMRKEMEEKKQKNSEIKLQERQLAESLGYSLTHALMRMSEDRLSGETMRSLTEFHTAIASKKKESEVQKMSSFFASSSIPENKST
jgi:hypothetical protein